MNLNDLLNMSVEDLNRMTEGELKEVLRPVSKSLNKRIKRLRNTNNKIATNALESVQRSGGNFSVSGKNRNQLRAEVNRAINFAKMKTSTVTGAKKVQAETETRLGVTLTKERSKQMWSAYSKLLELEPNFIKLRGSAQTQRDLANIMDNPEETTESAMQKMLNLINSEYEEKMAGEDDEMEGFFEF